MSCMIWDEKLKFNFRSLLTYLELSLPEAA